MIQKLQKKFALSEQGAKDLVKGVLSCALQNISFMFPVGILYCLVSDLLQGIHPIERFGFYVAGCVISLLLIFGTTYIQYNATYLATYVESGVRRIALAEKLRKIPLSFFGKILQISQVLLWQTVHFWKRHFLILYRNCLALSFPRY